MSRVNENAEKQRAEQARLEKQALKENRQKSDEFAKLVGQKQEQTQKANAQEQRQRHEATRAKTADTRTHAAHKLMARTGIQANKFQQAMAQQGQQNVQHTKQEVQHQKSENQEIRDFNTQQEQVRERKDMDKQERVQALSRDDKDGKGKGGGSDMSGGGSSSKDGDAQGQMLDAIAAAGDKGSVSATAEAQGAAGATKLSAEIIQKIVKDFFVGVNKQGLSLVHIDFKGTELEGTSMSLEADGNRIYARVFTDNRNLGRLFKASHTELAQALKKGSNLELEQLEVLGAV